MLRWRTWEYATGLSPVFQGFESLTEYRYAEVANGEMVEPLALGASNLVGSSPTLGTKGWLVDGETTGLENRDTM